jgi:hypothetical protein
VRSESWGSTSKLIATTEDEMPIVYFLVRAKVLSFNSPKLDFNVLSQDNIPPNQLFSVDWDQVSDVSPVYCEPPNPPLNPGDVIQLALSKDYCIGNGISIVGLGKRPDYLGAEAPPGGWFVLRSLRPKALVLETHDGTRLDLLDDRMVLPGGISSSEAGTLELVISAGAKALLGVAGALDVYRGPTADPVSRPTVPDPAGKPTYPKPPENSDAPEGVSRKRLSELFFAIGRVLE